MNELRSTDRPVTTTASYEADSPGPTQSRSAPQRPRVVIVGAGFGGLEAARALRNVDADVTLIDRRNFHLFQPLLYQVATAALSPGDIAWPIRSMFRGQKNVTVLMAEITGIDPNVRTVTDGTAVIPYDFLVLATGASHSYFGRGEWERHAPGLKTIDDATSLRQRLLSAFEHAELMTEATEKEAKMTIVVVGGGPTGVEMAGAVAELSHRTLPAEFRKIDPTTARIVLVEAGPRLLAAFPEKLSEATRRSLQRMHVEVRTNTLVTVCDEHGVTVGDNERIDAGTIIWAAGVTASPVASWLGAEQDRAGRAHVNSDLSVTDHPEIFVIGDTAAVIDKSGRTVPGVAPAAKQMGRYVAKRIVAHLTGARTPDPFVYHHAGNFAMIGRKSAVVSVGKIRLKGSIGWLLWSFAHIWFLVGFRSRTIVAFEWFWSYLTGHRGARLISDQRR